MLYFLVALTDRTASTCVEIVSRFARGQVLHLLPASDGARMAEAVELLRGDLKEFTTAVSELAKANAGSKLGVTSGSLIERLQEMKGNTDGLLHQVANVHEEVVRGKLEIDKMQGVLEEVYLSIKSPPGGRPGR